MARRLPSSIQSALIAGFAALAGVVAGGLITCGTEKSLRDDEVERQEAQDRAVTLGAARLLAMELLSAEASLRGLETRDRWLPLSERFGIGIPEEDRGLIAARATEKQWDSIAAAVAGVASFEEQAEAALAAGGRPLTRSDRRLIRDNADAAAAAAAALRTIAD